MGLTKLKTLSCKLGEAESRWRDAAQSASTCHLQQPITWLLCLANKLRRRWWVIVISQFCFFHSYFLQWLAKRSLPLTPSAFCKVMGGAEQGPPDFTRGHG